MDLDIDTALGADLSTKLLGQFSSTDAKMEPLWVRKTVSLPAPFIGIFLNRDLTTVEAWNRLCSSIVDGGLEVNFRPTIDWPRVSLTLKIGNDKYPLDLPQTTVPLANGHLIRYQNNMLTCYQPGPDPTLHTRVQGLLIATHIRDVAGEIRRDREEKALEY